MFTLARPVGTRNGLLARLPEEEYARLASALEPIRVELGQDLSQPDRHMNYVYFPTGAILSFVVVMHDGRSVEVAAVGKEGVVGIAAALGFQNMPFRMICQIPGSCLRLRLNLLAEAQRHNPFFEALLRCYAAIALRTAYQLAACNALHPVEARLCRWLVTTHERVGSDEFPMTHEGLALALGVRRQTVSTIAGTLQAAGFIRYARGVIRVQNRVALEAAACECCTVLTSFFEEALCP
jgi:CRP-like cAMP-binding protein